MMNIKTAFLYSRGSFSASLCVAARSSPSFLDADLYSSLLSSCKIMQYDIYCPSVTAVDCKISCEHYHLHFVIINDTLFWRKQELYFQKKKNFFKLNRSKWFGSINLVVLKYGFDKMM